MIKYIRQNIFVCEDCNRFFEGSIFFAVCPDCKRRFIFVDFKNFKKKC